MCAARVLLCNSDPEAETPSLFSHAAERGAELQDGAWACLPRRSVLSTPEVQRLENGKCICSGGSLICSLDECPHF